MYFRQTPFLFKKINSPYKPQEDSEFSQMLLLSIIFSNIILSTKELFAIFKGRHVEYECTLTQIFEPKNENDLNLFASDHSFAVTHYYKLEHKWFLLANARIRLNNKVYTVKNRTEIKMKQGVFKVGENDGVYTKIIKKKYIAPDKYKIKGFLLCKGDNEKTKDVKVWDDKTLYKNYFMRLNYKEEKTFLVFNDEFIVDQKFLDELAFSDFFSFKNTGDLKEKRFTFVGKHEKEFPIMKDPFLIVPENALVEFFKKFIVVEADKIMNSTTKLECIEGVKAYFIDDIKDVFMIKEDEIVEENTAKIDALNIERNKLESLLNDEKSKTTQFNDQISTSNNEITDLNDKIKTQGEELTKAMAGSDQDKQDTIRKIIGKKNQLETELLDAKTKYDQQSIDMDLLTAKKKELKQQVVQLTNDNNNMKPGKFTEINAQKEEIDDLKKTLQDKEKKLQDKEKKKADITTTQQPLTKEQEDLLSAALSGTDLIERNAQKEMSGREKTAWVLFGVISTLLFAFMCAICVLFKKYKK